MPLAEAARQSVDIPNGDDFGLTPAFAARGITYEVMRTNEKSGSRVITYEVMRTNEKSGSRVGRGCVMCSTTTRTGEPL